MDLYKIFFFIGLTWCIPVISLCQQDSLVQSTSSDTFSLIDSIYTITPICIRENKSHIDHIDRIERKQINEHSNENLANILEKTLGVRTLKNGNGISKPIVEGLYGSRLSIINNGLTQSGQQWGNDHSPEIDPLSSNEIQLIKGTKTLAYQGVHLGKMLLVNPMSIDTSSKVHGEAHYFFQSNGLGNGMHLKVEQNTPFIAWRINGTLKKNGDRHTPTHWLRNTGNEGAHIALQLEKSFSSSFLNFYFSSFNAKLGVLRGAHIGNLNDLQIALNRSVPFFTQKNFSYSIDSPRQSVGHHLLKIYFKYQIDHTQFVDIQLGSQFNLRKEWDIRRGQISNTPSLHINQYTYGGVLNYQKDFKRDLQIKTGLSLSITDNTNNPQTGILPLIPDYRNIQTGYFLMAHKVFKKSLLEMGIRYDNTLQTVQAISRTIPRRIITFKNIYHTLSSSFDWTFHINENFHLQTHLGFAMRNPDINERYSNGLHQGVSGIEEGDTTLSPEKGIRASIDWSGEVSDKVDIHISLYYKHFYDYIFLKPQNKTILTIRGAFPLFAYTQTQAHIYGLSLKSKINLVDQLYLNLWANFINGRDIDAQVPLVFTPANNLETSLQYLYYPRNTLKKLKRMDIRFSHQYVFKRGDIQPNQDFAPPPKGYYLMGLRIATSIKATNSLWDISLKINNVLNTPYRDYLNRQRYFSDDLGINAILGIQVTF